MELFRQDGDWYAWLTVWEFAALMGLQAAGKVPRRVEWQLVRTQSQFVWKIRTKSGRSCSSRPPQPAGNWLSTLARRVDGQVNLKDVMRELRKRAKATGVSDGLIGGGLFLMAAAVALVEARRRDEIRENRRRLEAGAKGQA